MKATIWHNPACGTSRKTLAILENLSGVEVTVVEYLKTPPSAEKLAQLYRDAGITPQQACACAGLMRPSAGCRKPTTRRCSRRWSPTRS